jgi:RNA recognition motif-containing protein
MSLKYKKSNDSQLNRNNFGRNNSNRNNSNRNNFNRNNSNRNNSNRNNNSLSNKICVKISNIPNDLTIKELHDFIKEWGSIGKINFNNNINFKLAFIDFYIKEEAEYFIEALDKTPFDNYIINVELLKR